MTRRSSPPFSWPPATTTRSITTASTAGRASPRPARSRADGGGTGRGGGGDLPPRDRRLARSPSSSSPRASSSPSTRGTRCTRCSRSPKLRPGRTTGVVAMRVTVHNQAGELVMEVGTATSSGGSRRPDAGPALPSRNGAPTVAVRADTRRWLIVARPLRGHLRHLDAAGRLRRVPAGARRALRLEPRRDRGRAVHQPAGGRRGRLRRSAPWPTGTARACCWPSPWRWPAPPSRWWPR